MSDQGVGEITAATPMTQPALEKALDGDYRLRGGMETRNGEIVSVYQALAKDQVKLTVYEPSPGWVAGVVVTDEAIESAWGVKIGTPFSAVIRKPMAAAARIAMRSSVRHRKAIMLVMCSRASGMDPNR